MRVADDEDDDRDDPLASDQDSSDEPDLLVCASCGRSISAMAEVCPRCGRYVSAEDAPRSSFGSRHVIVILLVVSLVGGGFIVRMLFMR